MKQNTKPERRHFPRSSEPRDMTKCFVMMPIKKGFDEVYEHVMKPVLLDLGITAIRADEIFSANPIIEDVWEQIQSAGWLIADLTGRNPNVLYELGLAHGLDRDVILLTQRIEDVPFDLQHWRCITYAQTIQGGQDLKQSLRKMLIEDSTYVHVPLALLTERFKDTLQILRSHSVLRLAGKNGARSSVDEEWSLSPTRSAKMREFIRKIQTSGTLDDLACTGAEAQLRKFMEGVFLITVTPPSSLTRGEVLNYKLCYKLRNGFAPGEEFWNFDFDCPVVDFAYAFEFEEVCPPREFVVVQRVKDADKLLPVKQDTDGKHTRYRVALKNVPSGGSLSFKWKWR